MYACCMLFIVSRWIQHLYSKSRRFRGRHTADSEMPTTVRIVGGLYRVTVSVNNELVVVAQRLE